MIAFCLDPSLKLNLKCLLLNPPFQENCGKHGSDHKNKKQVYGPADGFSMDEHESVLNVGQPVSV